MDLDNFKNKLRESGAKKIERTNFSGSKVDWLGWSIVLSAAIFAVVFVFGGTEDVLSEIRFRDEQNQLVFDETLYYYNAKHSTITPHQVYEQTRQALLAGDVDGVLAMLHPDKVWRYEPGLRQAEKDGILHEAAERMTPLTQKVYDNYDEDHGISTTVIYGMQPIPNNDSPNPLENYSERVEFKRDNRGIWKISGI